MLSQSSTWKRFLAGSMSENGFAFACGLTALLILPLARYANKGLAPLFVIFTLAGLGYWIARGRPFRMTTLGWMFAAAALLISISALWSITPMTTLKTALSVVGSLAGTYLLVQLAADLRADERRLIGLWIAYGGLIGLLIFIADTAPQEFAFAITRDRQVYELDVVIFWNARKSSFIVAMLFIWPWAIAAWRHLPRALTLGVLAIFVAMIALSHADAARGALLCGIAALIGGALFPRLYPAVLAIAIAVAVAALPTVVQHLVSPTSVDAKYDGFSESALHRIVIWQNTVDQIRTAPILGHGFDTSRSVYRGHGIDQVTLLPSMERRLTITTEPIPLHPHNIILQIWLEIGAVGAALFAVAMALIVYAIARNFDGYARALAYGGLTSTLFISNVSVGAWQAWWLAAIILTMTLALATLTRRAPA